MNRLSTSKLLILFLFVNCTVVELFTGWVIIQELNLASTIGIIDLSPLVTLIGAVVGEVVGYGVYSAKAVKENVAGGISYELAMIERGKE